MNGDSTAVKGVPAKILTSESFQNAVEQLTGKSIVGTTGPSIRDELRKIARSILILPWATSLVIQASVWNYIIKSNSFSL